MLENSLNLQLGFFHSQKLEQNINIQFLNSSSN